MNLLNDNNFDKSSHRQTVTLKRLICVMRREIYTEEVVRRYSVKKVFVKISQNSQENTCVKVSFLTMSQVRDLQLYLKREILRNF